MLLHFICGQRWPHVQTKHIFSDRATALHAVHSTRHKGNFGSYYARRAMHGSWCWCWCTTPAVSNLLSKVPSEPRTTRHKPKAQCCVLPRASTGSRPTPTPSSSCLKALPHKLPAFWKNASTSPPFPDPLRLPATSASLRCVALRCRHG